MNSIQDLEEYQKNKKKFDHGRSLAARTTWHFVSLLVFESGALPFYAIKRAILRAFGAKIGMNVEFKPNVRIKFPWRLTVGDNCWIGQDTWLDNLAVISIASNVCISQGAYLCTGTHDHRRPDFPLQTRPIQIGEGVWIGAKAVIMPGVSVGDFAVVAGGAIVTRNVDINSIVASPAAIEIGKRSIPKVG